MGPWPDNENRPYSYGNRNGEKQQTLMIEEQRQLQLIRDGTEDKTANRFPEMGRFIELRC